MWIKNSRIRTSVVNICRPTMVRWRRTLGAAPQGQAVESKPMQLTRQICYNGNSKMRNAFNLTTIIESSYRYRDNFDLPYRLSIENSLWHIVTALQQRHCGVCLKHNRTGRTEKLLSSHRGWQVWLQKHDGTDNHAWSKTLKTDTNLYLWP